MLTVSIRRWIAGMGAAGVLVAASATPALALANTHGTSEVHVYANNVTLAPGGPEKGLGLYLLAGEPPTDYSVSVDRRGVEDFATVRAFPPEGGNCSANGPILNCWSSENPRPGPVLLGLMVAPKDTAKVDQEGQLVFTYNAGGETGSYRSTVRVGEGVDLTAQHVLEFNGTPGSTVKAPMEVGNLGPNDARGAVLFFLGGYAQRPARQYRNCEYFDRALNWGFDGAYYACRFDGTIAKGSSAKLDDSFAFAIPRDTWAPSEHGALAIWFTPEDWEEFRGRTPDLGKGTMGDGGVLTLTPAAPSPAMARLPGQSDVDPSSNESRVFLTVNGDQKADVAAKGATVRAAAGKTAPLTVGYTNNGPAAINGGGIYALALVTLPKGTTATKAPEQCFDAQAKGEREYGKAGATVYGCHLEKVVHQGEKAEFTFSLRVDRAGALTGKVELFDGNVQPTQLRDLDSANNHAKILVNPAGGGDSGGGEVDGGTLPITGSSTALISGVGALLLAAGVGGYLIARRRRTRFVA